MFVRVNIDQYFVIGIYTNNHLKTRVLAKGNSCVVSTIEAPTVKPNKMNNNQPMEQQVNEIQMAVVISDYGRCWSPRFYGSSDNFIGKFNNIPVIVDPKGDDVSKYSGNSISHPESG